jgi:hypothetical protein
MHTKFKSTSKILLVFFLFLQLAQGMVAGWLSFIFTRQELHLSLNLYPHAAPHLNSVAPTHRLGSPAKLYDNQ